MRRYVIEVNGVTLGAFPLHILIASYLVQRFYHRSRFRVIGSYVR